MIIVNAARGGLVDEQALADAINSGHVFGAGLDVFETEPCTDSPLFELPQVVVTPHLGASTSEAQDRAGTDVAKSVKLALAGEFVPDAVNVNGGAVGRGGRAVARARPQAGRAARRACPARCPRRSGVTVRGELAAENVDDPAALGAARPVLGDHRGAGHLRQRARRWRTSAASPSRSSTASESPNHRSLVDVRAVYGDGTVLNVAGTLSGPAAGREDRQHQRPQLRPARRGPQPGRLLRRPARLARQDRHPARRRRDRHPGRRARARTPRAGRDRSCCA